MPQELLWFRRGKSPLEALQESISRRSIASNGRSGRVDWGPSHCTFLFHARHEIVRNNLLRFEELFRELNPEEQRRFVQLLVRGVKFDGIGGQMRLCLRPLPALNLELDQTGDLSKGVQIGWGVWTPFDSATSDSPLVELIDEFHFDFAVLAKGRRQPLYGQALEDYRKRRAAKERQPTPPRIQAILRQAHEFQARLAAAPGLTRAALAREVGISPTRMTMILHLANLAPEIQHHLLALPPSTRRPTFTERQLRTLARMTDHPTQLRTFRRPPP